MWRDFARCDWQVFFEVVFSVVFLVDDLVENEDGAGGEAEGNEDEDEAFYLWECEEDAAEREVEEPALPAFDS